MIDKKTYQEKFDSLMTKLNSEYEQFCIDEYAKTKEDIFNDCEKIRFYKSIYEYMEDVFVDYSNTSDFYWATLDCIADVPYGLLGLLYDFYLSKEVASVNTHDDITQLIADYCIRLIGYKEEEYRKSINIPIKFGLSNINKDKGVKSND